MGDRTQRWNENREGKTNPEKRPGVVINRRDLISVPVPSARLLWRDLQVRDTERIDGKQRTQNIRIDIIVEGVTDGKGWQCGLEFDYANQESFYCRPLRVLDTSEKGTKRMPVPDEADKLSVAFLPAMSGLTANETRLDQGAINVRIGEGTNRLKSCVISVIRFRWMKENGKIFVSKSAIWFGVQLDKPDYVPGRGGNHNELSGEV